MTEWFRRAKGYVLGVLRGKENTANQNGSVRSAATSGHSISLSSTSPPFRESATPLSNSNFNVPASTTPGGKDDKGNCGWLCFNPPWLQGFHTSKWALFWLCWAGAVQGMVVNGFVNVCITTIERRFQMKSADTGLIAGAYDIASLLCSIPVSYLGSLPGASKPRWLGYGILIMAMGSFVFAMPHFSTTGYKELDKGDGNGMILQDATATVLLCLKEGNRSGICAEQTQEWLSSFRHVFALGQFLHGVGASPLYTLGITYLDESVPAKLSSVYLGIFYAMAVVGPALGYLLGGQLLRVYIDTPSMSGSDVGLSHTSDQWLGAWWIGFLVSGSLAVVVAMALLAFPKEIPGSKKIPPHPVTEATVTRSVRMTHSRNSSLVGVTTNATANPLNYISGLPKATKKLLSNLTFVSLSLAGASEGILLTGFATFMPKFIESQFSLSSSRAGVLVGCVAVPAGGGGTLIGGWILKKFQLKCAAVLKLCVLLSFCTFLSYISFVISCPNTRFAGVTTGYLGGDAPGIANLTSSCNEQCACSNVSFDPVCGIDDVLYFSPCHAGCTNAKMEDTNVVFSNCQCIPGFSNSSISAIRNKCVSTCSFMSIFLGIFFVVMLLTFILSMPAVTGTLRSVSEDNRSLALGMQWIVIRVLGTIPGPIIFGMIIDATCSLWDTTCSSDGACRSYNNFKMSRSLMTLALVFKAISTLFFFMAWWFYVPRADSARPPDSSHPQIVPYQSSSNRFSKAGSNENRAFDAS